MEAMAGAESFASGEEGNRLLRHVVKLNLLICSCWKSTWTTTELWGVNCTPEHCFAVNAKPALIRAYLYRIQKREQGNC